MRGRLLIGVLGAVGGLVTYAAISGDWQFIERFSWSVIILGLPIAVYQLWLLQSDQNRVVSDLARKPALRTGFGLTKDMKDVVRELQVIPSWPADAAASTPVRIEWAMHNFGSRTAREVLQNLVIPEALANVMQPGTYVRYGSPDNRPYIQVPTNPVRNVHPGDSSTFVTQFPFPKDIRIIEVIVSTSMLDTPETLDTLHIHVQGP